MSNIRKHIIKIQEEREINQVSKVIVESRIREIVGGPDFFERFSQLSEEKKMVVSYRLFCELNELDSYGLIQEQDLWSAFKNMFGGFSGMFNTGIETIAEPIIGRVLEYVGLDRSSYFAKVVISFMTSNPRELIRAFTSCEGFSKLLAESLIEAYVMEQQEKYQATNNMVFNFLRNAIGNAVKGLTDPLAKELSKTVCSLFSTLIKNIGDLSTKLTT